MPIHIGKIIEKAVQAQKLTHREFGVLIHRNEKTIPDIFGRASMSTDLLITICGVLKIDFLSFYYSEEPLKSIRNHDCTDKILKLKEENKYLSKELCLTHELIDALREIIVLTKAQNNYLGKNEMDTSMDKNPI